MVVQLLVTLNVTGSLVNLDGTERRKTFGHIAIHQYVPWFVVGFIVLAILRSVEIIGEVAGNNIREFSRYSFLVAMLAIGMDVDIRDILNVGIRIALVICSVLLFVITISMLAGSHMVFA